MTARKEVALRRNVAPAPAFATIRPPRAGPTARARLKEAAFSETAAVRSGLGTISEKTACQAGPFIAEPIPNANVNAKSPTGEMA